jgi:hypothetical protein
MITLFRRTYFQNFDNMHFSSKPQQRWAEDGKELTKVCHMIINDVGQKYNHKPRDTGKLAT